MRRNLDRRVETHRAGDGPRAAETSSTAILDVYESDNCSAWDLSPDGSWIRRRPREGTPPRASQGVFMALAAGRPMVEARITEDVPTLTASG